MSQQGSTQSASTKPAVRREDLPAAYLDASEASRSGQAWYLWLVRVDLTCVLVAAVIGAIQPWPFVSQDAKRWLVTVIVAALVGAMIARTTNFRAGHDRQWFRGRSIAESVKTIAWKYMMRVAPYDVSEAEASSLLEGDVSEILASQGDLGSDLMTHAPRVVTSRMKDVRKGTVTERKECYLRDRLKHQRDWYSRNASENRRAARFWFLVGLTAQGGALVIALLAIFQPDALNTLGIFTTAATAATAFLQLRRHDELAKSYNLAVRDLDKIRERMENARHENVFRECVTEAEEAISREHKTWVARRTA